MSDMVVVVKQGDAGKWRWMVERGGETLALSLVNPGFDAQEGALLDGQRKLADIAMAFRPPRWWESAFHARFVAERKVRKAAVYRRREVKKRKEGGE